MKWIHSNGIDIYSDLHIGSRSSLCYKFDKPTETGHLPILEQLILKSLSKGIDVILNGDIFEFYCQIFPATLKFTLKSVYDSLYEKYTGFFDFVYQNCRGPNDKKPKTGGSIFYILGNHDWYLQYIDCPLRDKFWRSINFKIGKRRIYIEHFPKSLDARPMKKVCEIISPLWWGWFLYYVLDEPSLYYEQMIEDAKEKIKTNDICVYSHTHEPLIEEISKNKFCINSGMCSKDFFYDLDDNLKWLTPIRLNNHHLTEQECKNALEQENPYLIRCKIRKQRIGLYIIFK